MTAPLISVITPSFNQGEFITQNIDSVLQQNYSNFEHIIVDGGSSDETVSVLKSYPHLKWISEPDRGQSHALNKALGMAKGEIIAWLNSDDWYAPQIFQQISNELHSQAIILGNGVKTDRVGKPQEEVQNIERSWFDLLKYWVFYSVPEQPAIFFRRDALERVKLANGNYWDESLHYAMDLDLWLRLSQFYKFDRRIDRVCAYYRMYEDNKTGANMAAAYREMSRVFRQKESNLCQAESRHCFLIPKPTSLESLQPTILSLCAQSDRDFELLIDTTAMQFSDRGQFQAEISRISESLYPSKVRTLHSAPVSGYFSDLQTAAKEARAPLVTRIEPGTILPVDFTLKVNNQFLRDSLGFLLYLKQQDLEFSALIQANDPQQKINPAAIFSLRHPPQIITIRTVALRELGELPGARNSIMAYRELLLRVVGKAWMARVESNLCSEICFPALTSQSRADYETKILEYNDCINAQIILKYQQEIESDRFALVRLRHNFALDFAPETINAAKTLLQSLPHDWIKAIDVCA